MYVKDDEGRRTQFVAEAIGIRAVTSSGLLIKLTAIQIAIPEMGFRVCPGINLTRLSGML